MNHLQRLAKIILKCKRSCQIRGSSGRWKVAARVIAARVASLIWKWPVTRLALRIKLTGQSLAPLLSRKWRSCKGPSINDVHKNFGFWNPPSSLSACGTDQQYRDEKKGLQILLSYSRAGPGRKAKKCHEEISRNHVQTVFSQLCIDLHNLPYFSFFFVTPPSPSGDVECGWSLKQKCVPWFVKYIPSRLQIK